jgi:hypothetical protein
MLEEGVSDHRDKRMTVKALPGWAFFWGTRFVQRTGGKPVR